MGHEYVEMKNSHAAIEAYRKAVGTAGATEPSARMLLSPWLLIYCLFGRRC